MISSGYILFFIITYSDALSILEDKLTPPNNRYDENHTVIATLSSTTDTNQFLNQYNHDNKYNGLKLGQRIQINDGTYNKTWYIAGFDLEHNRVASDNTTYDNGYGIILIPEKGIIKSIWNNYATGYSGSYIHEACNNISNNLKKVLSDHLINRNVLLGRIVNWGYTND